MESQIPLDQWQPHSLEQVRDIFATAPFQWALAGGYAIEQFLGTSIRSHDDIDIMVYRDEQLSLQQWLSGWELYAADPPGSLRKWLSSEYLPYGIHDIWGHQVDAEAWQLQLMLAEVEGQEWFSRRSPLIRGNRESLIEHYNGVPCVRIDIQLMYKANGLRPKDDLDFKACLPLMDQDSKARLKEMLFLLYPQGHPWISALVEDTSIEER
ncbi:MAG: amino acid transporter [Anaerolineae bacterium]|nr:amino acid transporter [Anaerolineae bacterium]